MMMKATTTSHRGASSTQQDSGEEERRGEKTVCGATKVWLAAEERFKVSSPASQ
jgi:hypothetical protein